MPDSEHLVRTEKAEQGSADTEERARAESAARESQGIYFALLNATNQGFCTIELKFDEDKRPVDYLFLEVNPSFERQTGIENAVGRWMRDISPDQDQCWFDLYGRVALTGNPECLENFSTALDRWFSVYALKIEGTGRVAVLFDDITDRKRAEAALCASEERFRDFVTASANAIYRMSPDWSQMRQLDGQGFIGDTPEPSKDWMDRYILPKDRGPVQEAIDQAIRTKSKLDLEHRVIRADGTPGWTSSRATPMLDEHGEITEWLGTASDITQAKAARETLRESEERYRTLFEAIDSGFCIIEMIFGEDSRATDYRFVEANPAFQRQSGLVDAVGRRIREFAPDLEEHWFERYGRVALTGESMRVEGEVAPLGRWFDINAFRVGAPEQRRVAVLFTDITERRNAEDGLRESEEQQAFLLKLSDAIRPLADPNEVQTAAVRLLGEYFKADRADYYEMDADGVASTLHGYWTGSVNLPQKIRIANFGQQWLDSYLQGRNVVVSDIATDVRSSDEERAAWRAIDMSGALGVPLVKDGRFCAVLALATAKPRHWSDAEVALVEEVAERTWAAVERSRAEAERVKAEERFTRLFEASPAPFLVLAPDPAQFTITEVNEAYLAATMRTRDELVGRALFDAFPDNPDEPTSTSVSTLRASLERVLASRQPDELPGLKYDIVRSDGTFEERWWSPVNSPILDNNGEVEVIIHSAIDVTKERRAERHQGLLLAELQHRVRNILTMVRSIARRTADNCEDVDDYVRHLDGRLAALARVQAILTRDPGRGVDLHDMVLDELESQSAVPAHYQIDGPEVELSPKAAEVLSLAVHELATNSTKYGALSESRGTIRIRWAVEDRDGRAWLRWTWHEPVDSKIDRPARTGFGTELIMHRVPYELHGTGEMRIGDDEVEATINFPLADVEGRPKIVAFNKDMGQ